MADAEPAGRLFPTLKKLRVAALAGDASAARARFRRTIEGLDATEAEFGAQRQLVWTALTCGDVGFVSHFLSKLSENRPPVTVAIEDAPGKPVGAQAIICTYAASSGLRFSVSPRMVRASGVNVAAGRLIKTLPLFVECARAGLAREGRVALNTGDGARFAGVGYCANADKIGLIPDPDFMGSRGYETYFRHLRENPVPWEERHKVAIWRGTASGFSDGTEPYWQSFQRVKLCLATQGDYAGFFDVGISLIQKPPGHPFHAAFADAGITRPYMSGLDFQKYRYQIDVDGFTNAWSSLFLKLATGSPVLKVASRKGWRQWYYDRLKPMENYVPVEAEMSDLIEKVQWLMAHDDAARRIGAAGRALVLSLDYASQVRAGAETIAARMR